jgi:hypothetical protein
MCLNSPAAKELVRRAPDGDPNAAWNREGCVVARRQNLGKWNLNSSTMMLIFKQLEQLPSSKIVQKNRARLVNKDAVAFWLHFANRGPLGLIRTLEKIKTNLF